MKFALNDEQSALQDATRDFFRSRVSSDSVRAAAVSTEGYDKVLYSSMCSELGLTSLIVSESDGGFGASDVELAVVLEQAGYVLAPTPLRFHASAQIAVQECARDEQRSTHLARLVDGDEIATVLYADDTNDISPIKDTGGGSAVVSTTLPHVPFGNVARHLYLFVGDASAAHLVYVDLDQDGVSRTMVPSLDQTVPLAKLELTGAIVQIVSDEHTCKHYHRAYARAVIAQCNEMVGSIQAALDMAVTYAKDRTQFGRPIGSFQAIKHKCAEILLETESSRSISLYGAWLASQEPGFTSDDLEDNLSHVASMAKYYCSKALSHAAGENIQIHGGIGFTMEGDPQLYFKRAAYMNASLGLPHEHARKLASDLRQRTAR